MRSGEQISLDEANQKAIREELSRLVDSPAFRTSKRCKEFLEYIVERTLNGPGDKLKERSIGVDLFQLPPDFDTGQHTIVRVTANEVRKRLAQHYIAGNGAPHTVRIELPPGSYSADFKWETRPAGQPPAEAPPLQPPAPSPLPELEPLPPSRPASSRRSRVWIAALITLAAAASAFLAWKGATGQPAAAGAKEVVTSPPAVPVVAPPQGDLRFIVGASTPYVDRSGRIWSPDSYYSGGNVLMRPSARILRTLDPDLYRHLRSGDFRYDIPLRPGLYELHLHFAETGLADFISAESSGEGQRLFRVTANGTPILPAFDVVADAAGAHIATERVFRNIAPAEDGFLHLSFTAVRSTAMLNALELLPMNAGGTVKPLRIRAGWTSSWQDPAGQQWRADSYFMGGNALVRTTNPAQEGNSITPNMALYASERWGHFSYALPVAEGRYRLTLKFCEGHYGKKNTGFGGVGSRVFDVFSNGVALLRNFDIMKEAGGEGRPVDKVFSGLRPNAQGKIVLTFVPIVGMACVNGIEVVEEAK